MARPRIELHQILLGITPNVYFQPPTNVKLKFPCIVYRRDDIRTDFANNGPYAHNRLYQVTVIDRDPDSVLPDRVSNLPLTDYIRFFTNDDLNHDVFNLFY